MKLSICTTNYNCAHALEQHLVSVFRILSREEFEYIIVDNKSKDGSLEILRKWDKEHDNMKVLSKRCTMGRGRQISFEHSRGDFIMVIDTDVVYYPALRDFINICTTRYSNFAVQALYCGIFPRQIWQTIGGRRDLNTHEDLDMWMRIWKMSKMRWYPVFMGENLKEESAIASWDYLSSRYKKFEKIRRLIRSEYDRFKTRKWQKHDLKKIWKENTIDLGLGKMEGAWFESKPQRSIMQILKTIARESYKILRV